MAWMFVLFAVSFLFPTSVPGSCEDSSSDVSTNGTADPFPAHGGMAPCRAAASVHEAFSQALIGNKKPRWPLAWCA